MKRVGMVTDEARLGRMPIFVSYLKTRVDLKILTGESMSVDFHPKDWDVDVIIAKTKDPVSLALLATLEKSGIPIVNRPMVIFKTFHRFLLDSILSGAGIPQPAFAFSTKRVTPFDMAVVKDHLDTPPKKITLHFDKENKELEENETGFYYSQEFIDPECEYKIYGVGEDVITYRQDTPLIFNEGYREDKQKYRTMVDAPEVEDLAKRAIRAIGIEMCSMDIILSRGKYYVVDLNPSPGLRDEVVMESLVDYLLEVAR